MLQITSLMHITLFKKCDFSAFVSWDKLIIIINFGKDVIMQFQKCDFSAFVSQYKLTVISNFRKNVIKFVNKPHQCVLS